MKSLLALRSVIGILPVIAYRLEVIVASLVPHKIITDLYTYKYIRP